MHAELASGTAQLSQAGVHGRSQMVRAPPLILTQVTCPCSIKTKGCRGSMQKNRSEEACQRSMQKKQKKDAEEAGMGH